ncbi:MAG: Sec-independent protein translocase protein TatB [Blastomonas sp.]
MFDIGAPELLLCLIVAIFVIGPKELPNAMRMVGRWVGQARSMSRQLRSGFDAMVREAELEEMERKWAADNARIMRDSPANKPGADAMQPLPPPAAPEVVATEQAAPPAEMQEPGKDGAP